MSLQAIFLIFILSTLNITFANCIPGTFQKSELPNEMPENTKMKWSENGGMAPTGKSIEITGNHILFEEKKINNNESQQWSVEISLEDKKKLYQVFVENKFDKIENDTRGEIVYDAGSEGIYINAGKISKNVSFGPNFPLSGLNEKRYFAIASAIKVLESVYKGKATEIINNFAILEFDVKKNGYIFENAKKTDLNVTEILKIQSIIKKAVNDFNEDNQQTESNNKIKDLPEYKYQFIPVLNEKNEKEVYVNAFCSDFDMDWEKQLIEVIDGGNYYFQLYVNLTTNSDQGFSVNGEA